MKVKFRQGWTQFDFSRGDIQFFRILWYTGHYRKL